MIAALRSSNPADHWKVAALAYLIYGIAYLGGAWFEMTPERLSSFEGRMVPWWSYFVIGGAFTIAMPLLLLRQIRWLGGLLGVATGIKSLYLIWSQGRHIAAGEAAPLYNWFFSVIAIIASLALLRAVLGSAIPRETPEGNA